MAARAARALRSHGPALLLILLVAAAPFATCLVRGETPFFLDLQDHWYPYRLHAWRARQEDVLAHWCRHAFCGIPFLAQLEASLVYPPHWVLDLVHPAKTLLAQVIGHRFVLGALLYAVVRARGGSATAGALGGGLVVASGITMSCFTQLAVLRTLAWIPLVLLGATRLAQRRRLEGTLWAALGVALALVAGYPPFLQRAAVALPLLYLADPAWPRGADAWRDRGARLVCAAAGAGLGAAMAAAQLLPSFAFAATSQRQLGLDPALLDALRVELRDLPTLLAPRLGREGGIVKQGFAYLGVLPLALAAFAVVRRRPGAAAFAAAAGVALLCSMGRAVPLVGDALASLPVLNAFRNPGQYLVAWVLVVPVLAAMGLDAWRERRPTRREAACVLGGAAALLLFAALWPRPVDGAALARAAIGAAGLAAGALALLLPARAAVAVVVAASLADAGTFLFNYPTKRSPGGAPRTRSVASLVAPPETPFDVVARRHRETGREGPPRVITSDAGFNWENHGWAAGVENVRGLSALVPLVALDLNRIVERGAPFERVPPAEPLYAYGPTGALASPRMDLLAVGYAIGWRVAPGPEWRPIGDGVWERDAVPQARLPRRVLYAADPGLWRRLVGADFDPRTDAVLDGKGSPDETYGAAGRVDVLESSTNAVRMRVAVEEDRWLVWSETRDPGWTVTVDGAEGSIREANWAHMAVRVGPGTHEVVWSYEAPRWRAGVAVSVVAAGAFLLLAAVAARRRR